MILLVLKFSKSISILKFHQWCAQGLKGESSKVARKGKREKRKGKGKKKGKGGRKKEKRKQKGEKKDKNREKE